MVLPVKLDTMIHAPWYSQNEIMLANWGDIEGYLLCMSGCHCECDTDLLSDREETVTSDSLELEFGGVWVGGNLKLFDYSGMNEVAHCS